MPTRRQFLRDCSIVATVASLTPTALLAQSRGRRQGSSAELVFEQFANQLGTSLTVHAGPWTSSLLLAEASRLPAVAADSEDARNERFCMRFRGPAHQPLAQDTYKIRRSACKESS